MHSLFPSFHPVSIETFFNTHDIPTLAAQSSSLVSFVSKRTLL
jgi:hypothetical protein